MEIWKFFGKNRTEKFENISFFFWKKTQISENVQFFKEKSTIFSVEKMYIFSMFQIFQKVFEEQLFFSKMK